MWTMEQTYQPQPFKHLTRPCDQSKDQVLLPVFNKEQKSACKCALVVSKLIANRVWFCLQTINRTLNKPL